MATIDFPLTILEMSKMREDGDVVSLGFSYVCIICIMFFFILGSIYYLSSCAIFKIISIISVPLACICLLIVYISRVNFLSDESRKQKGLDRVKKRKYKKLDRLEGLDYEEALGKLGSDELKEYLSYETKKAARRALKQ